MGKTFSRSKTSDVPQLFYRRYFSAGIGQVHEFASLFSLWLLDSHRSLLSGAIRGGSPRLSALLPDSRAR